MTARKNARKSRASETSKFLEFRIGKITKREDRLNDETLHGVFFASAKVVQSEQTVRKVVNDIGKKGFFQTKREFVAGRVAAVLFDGEELNAVHRDRALAAIARKGWSKGDPANNARRTKLEHDTIRAAERRWTRFLDENKIANQEARGGHNKGVSQGAGRVGTGKAKGEATPLPAQTLLPPDAVPATPRVTSVEAVEKLTRDLATRLATIQKANALHMPAPIANAYVQAAKLLADAVESYHNEQASKCDLEPNLPAKPVRRSRKNSK